MFVPNARSIVFDSNLLLLLLVGSFEPRTLQTFKRLSGFSASDLRLLQAVSSARKILVTPNLLAEISNLANSLPERLRRAFHEYLAFYVPRISEVYLTSEILVKEQSFLLFGLGDASVVRLSEFAPIVTEDGRLRDYLRRQGRVAMNLADLQTSH